jgi:hypothetical protein
VLTFRPVKEAAGAFALAEFAEEFAAAAGEEFVDVPLVGDVEDDLIFRGRENPVQREREFHHAEIRADVSAGFGGDGNKFLPDFLRELRKLLRGEGFHIGWAMNGGEQRRKSRSRGRNGIFHRRDR